MGSSDLWSKSIWVLAIVILGGMAESRSLAQTFKHLVTFDEKTGSINGEWGMVLVQGFDGNLYGTTYGGGKYDNGTVFRLTPSDVLTTIYNFCAEKNCMDGANPYGGLVLGNDGNFYGTTYFGGTNGTGTVFKITPSGVHTPIFNFCPNGGDCKEGYDPQAPLVLGTDGNFYGITIGGGTTNNGVIFKLTPGGTETILHDFCTKPTCPDGSGGFAPLVESTDGNFYGTTMAGGGSDHCTGGCGSVFKITPEGAFTTLYGFCKTSCSDGQAPYGGLVQGNDGNFYGTTAFAGPTMGINDGTVFKITAAGTLTTLYGFCPLGGGCADGSQSQAGLVLGTDGNFYGTTTAGGASGSGVILKVTPSGKETVLYNFCSQTNCTDGEDPRAGLFEATNGIFYGTTSGPYIEGSSYGTIFSLSTGLAPFAQLRTASGEVGATVTILGMKLTGSTKVAFNSTPAKFTVPQSGEIVATVPADATTGYVTVTTPSGTLKSSTTFKVIPQIKSFEPTSGPVGTSVTITGVSLTQTSEVTFDGVKASFKKESDTEVTADVPDGAKTGKIAITTAGGLATSSGTFTVTP